MSPALLPAALALAAPAAAACRPATFEGDRFTVCRAERGAAAIRLLDDDARGRPLRSLSRAARLSAGRPVMFAMNAGMFGVDGRAIGLLVVDGAERHPLNRRDAAGNFYLKPNGVFWGDAAGWHVAATERYVALAPAGVRFATQSGPMLVIGGRLHPAIAADGPSRHRRNGVGIDARGDAWFAISDGQVSFGRFARLFRDALGCPDALYLDGSVSALWDAGTGRRDAGPPLGPIVAVEQSR